MHEVLYRTSLCSTSANSSYPHPALVNAVYLWGTYISSMNNEISIQAQRAYFDRFTKYSQMQLGNQSQMRNLQIVQAEVLVSTYLFAVGRNLEAGYHINAAVRLAMSFGMHQLSLRGPQQMKVSMSNVPSIEDAERVAVFWMVYFLDQVWAITNVQPAMLRTGDPSLEITTPWPISPGEYGVVSFTPLLPLPL